MKPTRFAAIIIFSVFLSGCASGAQDIGLVKSLHIGMDKEDVKTKIGDPLSIKASNQENTAVEMWDYVFRKPGFLPKKRYRYYLIFKNDKLAQWGTANDWGISIRKPDYIEQKIIENRGDKTTFK